MPCERPIQTLTRLIYVLLALLFTREEHPMLSQKRHRQSMMVYKETLMKAVLPPDLRCKSVRILRKRR